MCMVAIYTTSQAQTCDGPLTVEISGSQSSDPLTAVEDGVIQPTCVGPTGSIDITVTGGTPEYTFAWTKDGDEYSDAEDIVNAGAGVYTVEVTDASGCTTSLGPWTLEEPTDITIAGVTENLDCNVTGGTADGAITLTVSGGTPGYTYAWTTTDGSGLDATAQDQTGLGAGTYTVEVTDAAGCIKSGEFTITAPELFSVALEGIDPNCNADDGDENGSINATVSGGTGVYTYAWTTIDGSGLEAAAQNQTGLTAGTYEVVVTDENNCSVTASVTLEGAEAMEIAETTVDPSCHVDNGGSDGSIEVAVTGGDGTYTYAWTSTDGSGLDATAQNQTGLTAGTYRVEVSDAGGCMTWKDIELQGPDAIVADVTVNNPGCFGEQDGSIDVNAVTGGDGTYTYSWTTVDGSGLNATAEDQSGLSAGTYTLVVTDASNCSATFEYTIEEPMEITITTDLDQDLSCHADSGSPDGAIEITANGGSGTYTYAWSTTDGSGLDATAEDQSGLGGGTYYVTVSDATGCSTVQEYVLAEPSAITMGSTIIQPNCDGDNGSVWTAISGGQGSVPTDYTYTWTTTDGSGLTDGTVHQQSLSAGTYFLTVMDSNGCSNTAEFTLVNPDGLEATADVTTEILCNGGDATVSVTVTGGTGPYEYSINDGDDFQASNEFDALAAGDYTITVKDSKGCETEVDITVTEPDAFTAGTCTVVQDLCQVNEGEIKVEVAGGVAPFTVNWTSSTGGTLNEATGQIITDANGSVTFTGAEGGQTYSFTVTDANGCTPQ